jgi:hypothetical protein
MLINRGAVDQVALRLGDGMMEVGKAIIFETQPPDAPPIGEGLVRHGGAIVYVGKKKTNEWSIDGTPVKKPRALSISQDTVTVGVGFDRPARFDELGTIHQAAKPFFWPAVQRVVPRIQGILKQAVNRA